VEVEFASEQGSVMKPSFAHWCSTIISALPRRRPAIRHVLAVLQARTASLQNAIAKTPKRLEPARDFRARQDQVGVDDVLALQFPIVGLGEDEVCGNGRHCDHTVPRSMTIKRDLDLGHGCDQPIFTTLSILRQRRMSPAKFGWALCQNRSGRAKRSVRNSDLRPRRRVR